MAYTALHELISGNVDAVGELLHESWLLKRKLARKISNNAINEMYDMAQKAGAIGGKITGAGGGGFLLLYCPHERQRAVREALDDFQELAFQSEPDGTKVIFNFNR